MSRINLIKNQQLIFYYYLSIYFFFLTYTYRPSTTYETNLSDSNLDYVRAEYSGQNGELCDQIYSNCHLSFLNIFSKLLFDIDF